MHLIHIQLPVLSAFNIMVHVRGLVPGVGLCHLALFTPARAPGGRGMTF